MGQLLEFFYCVQSGYLTIQTLNQETQVHTIVMVFNFFSF